MYHSKNNLLSSKRRRAFTLVEIIAALTIIGVTLSAVITLMNRCIGATIDHRTKAVAFRIARNNMEYLLSTTTAEESAEFGADEYNPDIQWETVVETFTEPVKSKIWLRAVCSASYTDKEGERQSIELEHWLTDLTDAQQKQLNEQKKREQDFMEEFDQNPYGDDADGLMKYANVLADSMEYERAIDAALEVISEYPDSPQAVHADTKISEWEKFDTPLDWDQDYYSDPMYPDKSGPQGYQYPKPRGGPYNYLPNGSPNGPRRNDRPSRPDPQSEPERPRHTSSGEDGRADFGSKDGDPGTAPDNNRPPTDRSNPIYQDFPKEFWPLIDMLLNQ
jgi:prepilin-type N-terminal cleavage/methylation domain-containing protein